MDCKFLRQCLQQTYKLQPFITICRNIYMDPDKKQFKKPKLVNTACFGRRDMSNMLPLYRMSIICCLMCYQTRKLLSVEIFIDRNLYSCVKSEHVSICTKCLFESVMHMLVCMLIKSEPHGNSNHKKKSVSLSVPHTFSKITFNSQLI